MKSKILTILMSAAIALGLWLYVITVEQPESEMTYYNIPVVLQNEDILAERGLMIVSERPTVTLHLSSTRTNLNQLNESNINVIANVNSIVTAGTHELTYNVAYPGNVPSGAVSRQSSRPNMITLKVENRITRQIPVIPVYSGSVAEGLLADRENLVLDNAFIEVSGPESVA
jgi:YbbR domain-containing protein